jgi:cytoskeleton protein RodZ
MVRSSSEPQSINHQLQTLRQEKGLTLEEVSWSTRISLTNLRAIESLQYHKLPADPFSKGMLILYGTFLGLDGRKIAERFFFERDGNKPPPSCLKKYLAHRPLSPKNLAEPAHISSATIAGILMILITISFTGFCLYTSWSPFAFLANAAKNLPAATISPFHPADPSSGTIPGQADNSEISVLQDDEMFVALNVTTAKTTLHGQKTALQKKTARQNPLLSSHRSQFVLSFDPSSTVFLSRSPYTREDQPLLSLPILPFTP